MAEAVKVIVRCRPLNGREKNLKCANVVQMDSSIGQCRLLKPGEKSQPPKAFTFDGVFNTDSITESIYADICFPLVEGCVEGYNGTVFAYGQTGCGKSFTMQGIEDPPTQRGIIPRAFDHIFESIQVADNSKFLVHASYLEIYNEEIRDLLSKDHKSKLDVKEHPDRGVYVKDLSMTPCHNVKDMEKVMDKGAQNRSVGSTLMNADSSRSHSIFTIFVETCEKGSDGEDHIRAGKLNLVDLAGSERQAKTGASGDRLKEATKINLSLSALGNVISALVDGKSKHIPYRDSKLTRLLQDSLGGNTKTLMVACISPADNNYDETLSTLRYANRAKNIKNKPKINEDPKDALLRQYQDEINILKQVLMGNMQMTPDVLAKLGLNNFQGVVDALQPSNSATENSKITPTSTVADKETDQIRSEYEQKLSQIQKKFENEQLSKQKLQEEVGELQAELQQTLKDASKNVSGFLGDNAKAVIDGFNDNVNSISADVLPLDRNIDLFIDQTAQIVNESQPQQTQIYGGQPTERLPGEGTVTSLATQLQDEALKKLNNLQEKLVGGEKSDNTELKQKHKKKKEYASAREKKLMKDVKKWEGERIMVKVYDNLQEEIKAKRETIIQLEGEVTAANAEISDLQSEFQAERTDFLETIRKMERQMLLQTQILEKIQPTIRRDCNYFNIDRMKILSEFDEETQKWRIPELQIEKTSLPKALPGQESLSSVKSSSHSNGKLMDYHERTENDRFALHIQNKDNEEYSNQYFRPKRANKILASNIASTNAINNNSVTKLQSLNGLTSPSVQELPAARRPQKLEALPLSAFEKKKSKKSKNQIQ